MPAVWFALKRSLRCKTKQRDVHDPDGTKKLSKISTKRSNSGRSGCSRSIANLKDVVIHGSKRHTGTKPTICSPRSIGSSELLNPITHEVVLNNSTCELKVSAAGHGFNESNFVGMLKPGTPGPMGFHVGRGDRPGFLGSPVRRTASSLSRRSSGLGVVSARPRSSFGPDSNGVSINSRWSNGDQVTAMASSGGSRSARHGRSSPTDAHLFEASSPVTIAGGGGRFSSFQWCRNVG
ncbi:zinc finger protein-related [Striga hermonthica]|uniref:Zinc finger protein-related n=1 Tax=Striga hermonthica TaxID=68872 RepID=A0A9N7ND03_STRHE|nr:zinc finger protein-related [Striga hermonthica]